MELIERLQAALNELIATLGNEPVGVSRVSIYGAELYAAIHALQSQAAECARLREALEKLDAAVQVLMAGAPTAVNIFNLSVAALQARQALSQEPTP